MINVAVIYYSATGNVHALAVALAAGARQAGAQVRLRRAPELAPDRAIDSNPAWRAHTEATRNIPEATLDDRSDLFGGRRVFLASLSGGAVGATAGGVLTGLLSWRWIFFVNVPVGAGLLAAAWFRLPRTRTGASGRLLDLAGAVTVTAGLVTITWALIRAQASGWASAQVAGALTAGFVLLGVFAFVETRVARAPLMPFSVFRSRLRSAGNAFSFLRDGSAPARDYAAGR